MKTNTVLTLGEWLEKQPGWKQALFPLVSSLPGAWGFSLVLFGYRRAQKGGKSRESSGEAWAMQKPITGMLETLAVVIGSRQARSQKRLTLQCASSLRCQTKEVSFGQGTPSADSIGAQRRRVRAKQEPVRKEDEGKEKISARSPIGSDPDREPVSTALLSHRNPNVGFGERRDDPVAGAQTGQGLPLLWSSIQPYLCVDPWRACDLFSAGRSARRVQALPCPLVPGTPAWVSSGAGQER
jgi:hypothetical protein